MASKPLAYPVATKLPDYSPPKRGRPSLKTDDIVSEILDRLSHGEPLATICADKHMPHFRTVWRWEEEDASFCQASTRAREIGTHYIADDCIKIADQSELDPKDRRIKIDTRLRLIGQWNRKVYGQSVQLEGEIKISVASALEAARQRVIEGTAKRIEDDQI